MHGRRHEHALHGAVQASLDARKSVKGPPMGCVNHGRNVSKPGGDATQRTGFGTVTMQQVWSHASQDADYRGEAPDIRQGMQPPAHGDLL